MSKAYITKEDIVRTTKNLEGKSFKDINPNCDFITLEMNKVD